MSLLHFTRSCWDQSLSMSWWSVSLNWEKKTQEFLGKELPRRETSEREHVTDKRQCEERHESKFILLKSVFPWFSHSSCNITDKEYKRVKVDKKCALWHTQTACNNKLRIIRRDSYKLKRDWGTSSSQRNHKTQGKTRLKKRQDGSLSDPSKLWRLVMTPIFTTLLKTRFSHKTHLHSLTLNLYHIHITLFFIFPSSASFPHESWQPVCSLHDSLYPPDVSSRRLTFAFFYSKIHLEESNTCLTENWLATQTTHTTRVSILDKMVT